MEKIKLNVPYDEKNDAKKLGARWDVKEKTWYITSEINPNLFERWLPETATIEINNALAPIFVITSYSSCWKCKKESTVNSLASSGYYHNEKKYSKFTVYSYLEAVSPAIEITLAEAYPAYRLDFSNTTKTRYFLNHCEFCDAKMGDFFLHEECDCAFSPTSIKKAKRAKITTLNLSSDELMIFGQFYRPYPSYIERYASRDKKTIFKCLFYK